MSETNLIETERLALRLLTMDDLDALAAIYRDPDVRRYFPEGTLMYEQTKEELEWIINVYYGEYGFGLWATIHKETGEFIGRCGLLPWTIDGRSEVEVAYLLARRYWGQGLGTEAARAILAYGFEELRLTRLISLIDPANAASVKVAVNIGMSLEREADIDGERTLVYSTGPASLRGPTQDGYLAKPTRLRARARECRSSRRRPGRRRFPRGRP